MWIFTSTKKKNHTREQVNRADRASSVSACISLLQSIFFFFQFVRYHVLIHSEARWLNNHIFFSPHIVFSFVSQKFVPFERDVETVYNIQKKMSGNHSKMNWIFCNKNLCDETKWWPTNRLERSKEIALLH